MTYYTDEQRKRAVATRQRNRQLSQLLKSPEDIYDILGVSVPRVSKEPQLMDYDLPEGIEQTLEELDRKSLAEKKNIRRSIFLSTCLVLFALGGFYLGIGMAFAAFLGLFPFILIGFYVVLGNAEPEKTSLHERFQEYTRQRNHYDYWQRKKDKAHWNNMGGYEFERATANLFRRLGYTAKVSVGGGDGGVDIVLQKEERRIAVQCKRYKSAVGPHIIRDLWGTMHSLGFEEGCIVTTTGFTKGVSNFASGKKIYLVDLNDILRATEEGGDAYLSGKLGQ